MNKIFANFLWIYLSGKTQKMISSAFSLLFRSRISRLMILPYCLFFGLDANYLDQFEPESEKSHYSSYSDFFCRKLKTPIQPKSEEIWPCEGYACDWGYFLGKNYSVVKGTRSDLNRIFQSDPEKTQKHFFVNIFLHNHNYHRVHAPVSGEIKSIRQIPGDLHFLRPWFYSKQDRSFPAFRNERLVFEIQDQGAKTWWMALVGGFGVGTMELAEQIQVGSQIQCGQELALFRLGSTVCLASPYGIELEKDLQFLMAGEQMRTRKITTSPEVPELALNGTRPRGESFEQVL